MVVSFVTDLGVEAFVEAEGAVIGVTDGSGTGVSVAEGGDNIAEGVAVGAGVSSCAMT